MLTTDRLASSVPAASRERTTAGELHVPLEDGVRAVPPGPRVELVDGRQQAAQPRARLRGDGGGPRRPLPATAACGLLGALAALHDPLDGGDAWLRSERASRVTASTSRASSRHGPAVIIRTSAGSLAGSAMARRAWSRSRISGVSKRLSPPTTVYGMSSSRRRSTMASRCLCLRYRIATSAPGPLRPVPGRGRARASTMATASSSAPGADEQLDRGAGLPVGPQRPCRARSGCRCARSAGWRRRARGRRSGSSARWRGGGAGRAPGRPGRARAGRENRASNSAKAAKLAPRKR